jgi:hypothetical protein
MHVRIIFWMWRVRVMGELDESFGAQTIMWDSLMSQSTTRQHPHDITRYFHHQHDSAASSTSRFDSDIVPWPTSPRQCHRQHDSAAMSCHDQRRLGSAIAIANMTQQQHHTTTNVASTAPSPERHGSAITSTTEQRHR